MNVIKYYIKILLFIIFIVLTAELSDSLSINKDIPSSFFVKIGYKDENKENSSIETKSNKMKIKSNNIDLNHEILFFKEINYDYGYLYFTISLKNNKCTQKFKEMKIKLSKLNLNKRQRITMNYPSKSKFLFNYIISNNKEDLNFFLKKAKDKRDPKKESENLFDFFKKENNDDIDEEESSELEESEEEEDEKEKVSQNNNKNEIEGRDKDNEKKNNKTNKFFQIFNIEEAKLDNYNNIKLPDEKITVLKPQKTKINKKENINVELYDTFCQGFFITSFPKNNGKIIENSKHYNSICGHLICGKLPAMEPEIIYKYPLEDTKDLELNNLSSSVCFPTGIKVCYNQDKRSTYKSFSTHIVNQKGKKYYLSIYHFYYQLDTVTYNKIYSENPLKYYLRQFGDNIYHSKEEKLKLEKDLEECQELGFKEFVYIPYAIVLISKYPYLNQMKNILNKIFIILSKHKNILKKENKELNLIFKSIINDLIIYLIKIIPIPKPNSNLIFNLPFSQNKISILSPSKNNIRNLIDVNFTILLRYFSIDDILKIYRLILFEQKLLFIDNNYNRIYTVIENFKYLLYPIEWVNTTIPIMSHQMTRYLQTFLPFINGISEDLFNKNAINALNETEDEVFEIYISKGKILSRKNDSECFDNISKIPNLIYKKLYSELNDLKEIYANLNDNEKILYHKNINDIFSNIFLESNAIMLYDFMDFIFNINENNNNLEEVMLRIMINNKYIKEDFSFYNDLIDSQIFLFFINNIICNKNDYSLFISMLKNIHEKYIKSHYKNKETIWKNIVRKIELKDIINYKKSTSFNIPSHLQNSSCDNSIKRTYIINYDKWTKINNKYFSNEKEANLNITKTNINDNINSEYINETDRIALNLLEINNNLFLKDKEYEKYTFPKDNEETNNNENTNKFQYKNARANTLISLEINNNSSNFDMNIKKKANISSKNVQNYSTQKSKYLVNLKNELELTDEEKENMQNNFKMTLTKLFEDNCDIPIDECIRNVYYNIGRNILCKIIFYKGFRITQIMNDNCFLLLKKIFLNALISICNINENQEILDFAVKITQSSFYYCKESNNNILLIDELRSRLGKDYFMWIKKSFWNNWQNIENYFAINNYSVYCDIIKCEFLFKLLRIKIDKDFIINYLKECLEEKMILMKESINNNKNKTENYNDLYLKTKIEIIKIIELEEY